MCVSAKKKRPKTDTFKGNRRRRASPDGLWLVLHSHYFSMQGTSDIMHFKKRQFRGTDTRRLRSSKSWPCDKNHRSVFILCDLHSNRRKLSEKTLTDRPRSSLRRRPLMNKNKKHFPSAPLRLNRSTSSFQSESIPFVGGLSLSTSQIKSS